MLTLLPWSDNTNTSQQAERCTQDCNTLVWWIETNMTIQSHSAARFLAIKDAPPSSRRPEKLNLTCRSIDRSLPVSFLAVVSLLTLHNTIEDGQMSNIVTCQLAGFDQRLTLNAPRSYSDWCRKHDAIHPQRNVTASYLVSCHVQRSSLSSPCLLCEIGLISVAIRKEGMFLHRHPDQLGNYMRQTSINCCGYLTFIRSVVVSGQRQSNLWFGGSDISTVKTGWSSVGD